jgi:hypothetical protein
MHILKKIAHNAEAASAKPPEATGSRPNGDSTRPRATPNRPAQSRRTPSDTVPAIENERNRHVSQRHARTRIIGERA